MQKVRFVEIDGEANSRVREVRPAEFVDLTDECVTGACVRIVAESDWDELAPICGQVEDRGTKHPAKGLNPYLLDRKRVPVIRAAY